MVEKEKEEEERAKKMSKSEILMLGFLDFARG